MKTTHKTFVVCFVGGTFTGFLIGAAVALNHSHEHAVLVGTLIGAAAGTVIGLIGLANT